MNISGSLGKINEVGVTQRSQRPIDSIEKVVSRGIVYGLDPLPFQKSPESFCYVEMWGIRRQEEKKQTSLLPNTSHFLHESTAMNLGIVKHNESVSSYSKREFVEEGDYPFGGHAIHGGKSMIITIMVNHTPHVKSGSPFRWNCYVLPWELPSIRYISFGAHKTSISEIEVDQSVLLLFNKLLQLLLLISVELRRGCPFGRFPYTSKSCAKADKKALNVSRLASLPVACCHLSLAFMTLSLSFSIASITACVSELSMIGLHPCPGLLRSPSMPSERYRFTQRLTLCSEHDNFSAIALEDNPSALYNTIWLLICIKERGSKCKCHESIRFVTGTTVPVAGT